MSIPGAFATALAAALLLSSCAPSSTPVAEHTETPTPTPTVSQPAFLQTGQSSADLLPADVAQTVSVDPVSTRFQGSWDGHQIFLALKDSTSVCLVTGLAGDGSSWASGCGTGNEVVTDQLPDGGIVKYLPMTTSAVPAGWTRLSDHVFAM
ncbi:MAG TPA: hypothetical protein VGM70_08685 [Pseudolysinimonas sp.]|jgi:hypothetical protein